MSLNPEIKEDNPRLSAEAPAAAKPSDVTGKVSAFLYATLALTLVAAVLRVAASLYEYESAVGYFVRGGPLYAASNAAAAVCVLLAAVSFFLIPKGGMPIDADYRSSFGSACLDFVGFMLFFEALYRARELFPILRDGSPAFDRSNPSYADARPERIIIILSGAAVIFCAIAAFYYLWRAIGKTRRRGLMAFFGLFPGFRAVCGFGIIYFDLTVAINSPVKASVELALICVMLWSLLEVRFLLPYGYAKPRLYYSFSLATVAFCLFAGVSVSVMYLCGIEKNANLFIESVYCLITGLLALVRLFQFSRRIAAAAAAGADGYLPCDLKPVDEENDGNAPESAAEPEDGQGSAESAEAEETGEVPSPEDAGDDIDKKEEKPEDGTDEA